MWLSGYLSGVSFIIYQWFRPLTSPSPFKETISDSCLNPCFRLQRNSVVNIDKK